MNMKLVIVWLFAIVLIGGIGLFGWMNQDLLIEEDNTPYTPSVGDNVNTRICTNQLTNGSSSYSFAIDEATASVTSVVITYNQTLESLEDYEAANRIAQANVNGATAVLSGGVSDFVLIVTVTVSGFDTAAIETINSDLLRLGIVVDSITDYETYKTAINNVAPSPYTCD